MSTTRKAAIPRASEAWYAALADDMDSARVAIEALAAEQGPDAVVEAILLWLDTLLTVGFGQDGFIDAAGVQFVGDGEEPRFADGSQRPEVVWSGRMLTARATGDVDTFGALIAAATTDTATWGRHVMELLQCAAMTYRMTTGGDS